MNNLPKATSPLTDTHTHRQRHTQKDTFCCQFLNKFSFASHKQPQVVSAIVEAFKLWNYITHVYRDVFVRFPELSKHSRRKETGGIKKKKERFWKCSNIAVKDVTECWNMSVCCSVHLQAQLEGREEHSRTG